MAKPHEVTRLAAASGVDPTTVRRFLNDPTKARRSTCRLVVESAEKLGLSHVLPEGLANGAPDAARRGEERAA